MADRFVSPSPPTPREVEAAVYIIEECAEIQLEILRGIAAVQQRATKLVRFGPKETQPGMPYSNATRLSHEVGDLLETIALGIRSGILIQADINRGRDEKRKKIAKYLQTEPDHE